MRKKNPPKINIGEKYGRWTVVDVERVGNYYRGICHCNCGNTGSVRQDTLLNGESSSCGCYSRELLRTVNSKRGGITVHPLYQRWYDMNRCCLDPRRKDFHHYGGRGISICDDWIKTNPNGFVNFLNDMENSYVEGLELDRVNNDGNYCKENCKWSTRSEQVINRREVDGCCFGVRFLEDGEDTLHLAAMAKKHNMSSRKLQDRITKLGWSLEDALTRGHRVKSYSIIIEGVCYKLGDIFFTNMANRAREYNLPTGQVLRSILKDSVIVMAKINGQEVEILPESVVGKHNPIIINDTKFRDCFKPEYTVLVRSKDAI